MTLESQKFSLYWNDYSFVSETWGVEFLSNLVFEGCIKEREFPQDYG